MRILMLTPALPYPPYVGGAIRVMELLRFLQRRHRVTVVTFISSEHEWIYREEMAQYCEAVVGVPRRVQRLSPYDSRPRRVGEYWTVEMYDALQMLNQIYRFDLVDIQHIWMAQYAPLVNAPAVLHEHNIESQVLKRHAEFVSQRTEPVLYTPAGHFRDAHLEWSKLVEYENYIWPKFPLRITVSNRDAEEMIRRCPTGRVVTIPNGVDSRAFLPVASLDSVNALFVGSLDYQPNLDAAFELCDVIWPLVRRHIPQACLYIIGSSPPPELLKKREPGSIEVFPNVSSLVPYAALCSVSLVPIMVGGGTRVKILTSMALGLPVISTTIGCEGLALEGGRDILMADTSVQFAQQIVYLLQQKEMRLDMARNGRSLVETYYDWHSLLAPLEDILEDFVSKKH